MAQSHSNETKQTYFTVKSRLTTIDWDSVAKSFRKVLTESEKIFVVEGEWGGMDDTILIMSDKKSSKELYHIIQETIKTLAHEQYFFILAHHPRPHKTDASEIDVGNEPTKCHEY